MNRRIFLVLGSSVTVASAFFGFFGDKKEDKWRVLQSVQNHLFPKQGNFPDAESISSVRYLKMVSRDDSFDQKDLEFIFEGLNVLQDRGWKTMLAHDKKEKILETFAQTNFGENWISTLLNYTLEAVLSDPIYGGNSHQKGWRSLEHHPGIPRPKVPFGRLS